ncbi:MULTISPECIES: PilZ domain-containing protein [Thioalkalivibrio]|uniref:PilZ domain-containing protein n=1 Tax=Thioalkalivibrio TaxID=106633 RepID=UPI0003818C93|nr:MULTISPECIES: PilZ domain-containing protein [Thioalkalivibrio]OOC48733.1 PilZ domain-containing protein [Thioalkalivibrio versutus]
MIGEEDRRDHRRMQVSTAARVTWRSSGESISVQLEDLSAMGCAFVAQRETDAGVGITVSVPSPDGRLEGLERHGRVVRCAPVEGASGNGWRVAVAFDLEG